MAGSIASHCDTRCQYANPEIPDCNCECGGKNHGQGTDTRIWEIKNTRLGKTRKAFRKMLNKELKGQGTKLYRKNRAEFDRLYETWKLTKEDPSLITDAVELDKQLPPETITTVHSKGMDKNAEITVIKDAEFNGDTYSHIRRIKNGKTEYRKNDKLTTKGQIPVELGW